jgi:chromosomal replication initiation ATPase DnaA
MDNGIEIIRDYVCEFYGISSDELKSPSRKGEFVKARKMILMLKGQAKDRTIAEVVGRAKCTMSLHRKKFTSNMRFDKRLQMEFDYLKRNLSRVT